MVSRHLTGSTWSGWQVFSSGPSDTLEGQGDEALGDAPLPVRGSAGIAPAAGTLGGALCPVPGENVTRGYV